MSPRRWIEWLIPPPVLQAGGSAARRANVAVGVLLFVLVTSVLVSATRLALGFDAPIALPTIGAVVALMAMFRISGNLELLAHGLGALLSIATVILVALAGGVGAPPMYALAIIPLLIVFIGGLKPGAVWLTFCCLAQIAFKLIAVFQVELPVRAQPERALPTLGGLLMSVGVFVLAYAYERARAADERARDEKANELAALLRAFPDIVLRLDRSGRVLDAHSEHVERLHPDPHTMLLADLFEERATVEAAVERAVVEPVELEVSAARSTWNLRLEPFGGGLLAVARDVTGARQMEAALVEAQLHASLERADRMSSIGILAAGMAHEVNNPLAYLAGNLSFLAERLAADAEGTAALNDAQTAVERIRRIVADLKLHARSEEPDEREEAVRLAEVVSAAVNLARNELLHRAHVEVDEEDAPLVLGNERRLVQVILNVLVNAAQAIPPGNASDNLVAIRIGTDRDGCALVRVRDTGPGIPAEILDKVTQPFFTTKPPGVGTGLGLSVCAGIVQGLGGTLSLASPEGGGAEVTIRLPPAPPNVVLRAPERSEVRVEPKPGRILVVDDEPLVRRALRRLLRRHDVVEAASGASALEVLAEDDAFDAILCDVMMPDVTGIELYQQIREQHPELGTRLVFMTGGAFDARVGDLLEAVVGDATVVQKPFQSDQLRRVLADLLGAA
ncbi:MAG: ATP-binding protein [Sandaracinaceae bacterium]